MVLTIDLIEEYLECPYKILVNKGKPIKNEKDKEQIIKDTNISKFKKIFFNIAAKEMNKKKPSLTLSDYRTIFTDNFSKMLLHRNKIDLSITEKLNGMLDVFANNYYIAYNLPIEFPIVGTSFMLNHNIDFLFQSLIDKSIIYAVQISDLGNFKYSKKTLISRIHTDLIYKFLAKKLDKTVEIIYIDPFELQMIYVQTSNEDYDSSLEVLCTFLSPITMKDGLSKLAFIANFRHCKHCNAYDICTIKNTG